MALFVALIFVAGFVFLTQALGVVQKSSQVIEIAQSAALIVTNKEMDDYAKEVAMQQYAKSLFSLFFSITGATILALGIPFCFVWLMALIGLVTINEVIEMPLSWYFIVSTTILSVIYFIFTHSVSRK